jgi:tetratricopeptide (TPR) repeat protein
MQTSGSERLSKLLALHAAEPNDGFVLYGLAQECQKLGQFDEAIRWYDRAIDADPKQCYAFFHKAKALEAAKRSSEVASTQGGAAARPRRRRLQSGE